jgi:hypothetical protein
MNILGIDLEENLKKLSAFAEANPFYTIDLVAMHNGSAKKVGDMKEFILLAPLGTKIVYCVENDGVSFIRYLSISFMDGMVRPPIMFVQHIMEMIGFKNPITNCVVGFEEFKGMETIVIIREIIEK